MKTPFYIIGLDERSAPDELVPVADCGAAATASGADSLDAPPSNRASNTCNGVTFQLLSRHIDSLELSYRGDLYPEWELLISKAKERAKDRDPCKQALAQVEIGDRCFEVRDKGYGLFSYVLSDSDFRITLSGQASRKLPLAWCQIRNHYLLSVGPEAAAAELAKIVTKIGNVYLPETVSRIDPAVDFVTDIDLESWGRDAWITKLRSKQSHSDGELFTGWSIGNKGSLSFGLYNKTHEIQTQSQHKADYMHEIWERSGWVPWDTVWRVEFRLKRAFLTQFEAKSLADVLGKLDSFWQYATNTSLRLSEPGSADLTRSRHPIHPLWKALAAVSWNGPPSLLQRKYKQTLAPRDSYLGRHTASQLTSLMGREGITEPGLGWERLKQVTHGHLEQIGIMSDKSVEEVLIEKVKAKGRRYSTMNNVAGMADAERLRADADAYERASKG